MSDQITQKTLRDADWKRVYSYLGVTQNFDTFASDALPGITITHTSVKGAAKTRTTYTVNGRKTDSPSQAVRYYNAEARQQAGIRSKIAGSIESLRLARRTTSL